MVTQAQDHRDSLICKQIPFFTQPFTSLVNSNFFPDPRSQNPVLHSTVFKVLGESTGWELHVLKFQACPCWLVTFLHAGGVYERNFLALVVKVKAIIIRTSVPEWKAYRWHPRTEACTVQQAGCSRGRECSGNED